jgi:hypothetical protein
MTTSTTTASAQDDHVDDEPIRPRRPRPRRPHPPTTNHVDDNDPFGDNHTRDAMLVNASGARKITALARCGPTATS